MSWTVGELARLAGVTVRTLHHYDRIGLLRPGARTAVGHRRYDGDDVDRLHQVLVYRALGFPLEEVATLLDDPDADPAEHLRRQHRLLRERLEATSAMVAAVEKEMEARQMGTPLTPEERFEVFGDHDPTRYEAEAAERWGDGDEHAQSSRRTAAYGRDDWQQLQAEAADIEARLARALTDGVAADSPAAMDLAEEHRQHIGRWFYDCSPSVHAALGEMYVADPRFTAHYEQVAPGLAQFVSDAVRANAARAGG
jgi:DNA-binding transcriptional MerR regulator